jgi:hypothetical protein
VLGERPIRARPLVPLALRILDFRARKAPWVLTPSVVEESPRTGGSGGPPGGLSRNPEASTTRPCDIGPDTPQCVMPTWTCDTCGATGEVPPGSTSDQVLCDTCGEPVLPDDSNPPS